MTLCPDVVSGSVGTSGLWSQGPGHCANIETYCEVGGCYYEVMSDNIIIVITASVDTCGGWTLIILPPLSINNCV